MQGFELVFYGDSISEDWRGTSAGIPWPLASGTADVFYKHFGSKYNAEVLAIAGGRPKLLACQPAATAMPFRCSHCAGSLLVAQQLHCGAVSTISSRYLSWRGAQCFYSRA